MTISLALVWLLLSEDGSTHMPPSQLAQWAIFENGVERHFCGTELDHLQLLEKL